MFVVRCCINASHHFVGAIPLFSPPLSLHNFSLYTTLSIFRHAIKVNIALVPV